MISFCYSLASLATESHTQPKTQNRLSLFILENLSTCVNCSCIIELKVTLSVLLPLVAGCEYVGLHTVEQPACHDKDNSGIFIISLIRYAINTYMPMCNTTKPSKSCYFDSNNIKSCLAVKPGS